MIILKITNHEAVQICCINLIKKPSTTMSQYGSITRWGTKTELRGSSCSERKILFNLYFTKFNLFRSFELISRNTHSETERVLLIQTPQTGNTHRVDSEALILASASPSEVLPPPLELCKEGSGLFEKRSSSISPVFSRSVLNGATLLSVPGITATDTA